MKKDGNYNTAPTTEESIRIFAEIIVDVMFESGMIDEITKETLPIEKISDLPVQDKKEPSDFIAR